MSRWKAFSIHLALSVAVFVGLLLLILSLWYPGILFSIDGGWNGLKIVMGVDVILGPLLTLVVFRAAKPGLKFDLSCIAAAQIACMAAGLWVVYNSRPIALVFAYDTFYSLAASEFRAYDRDPSVLREYPGPWPKLVYTELPQNEISADIANVRSQFIGDPLFMQMDKFRPIPDEGSEVFRREAVVRESAQQQFSEALEQAGESCVLSRFVSAHKSGFVCFDPVQRKLTRFFAVEA